MSILYDIQRFLYSFLFTELSRNALIQLAMLVGSDYANGLAGVGPVTAL